MNVSDDAHAERELAQARDTRRDVAADDVRDLVSAALRRHVVDLDRVDADGARDYLNALQQQGRYARDVY